MKRITNQYSPKSLAKQSLCIYNCPFNSSRAQGVLVSGGLFHRWLNHRHFCLKEQYQFDNSELYCSTASSRKRSWESSRKRLRMASKAGAWPGFWARLFCWDSSAKTFPFTQGHPAPHVLVLFYKFCQVLFCCVCSFVFQNHSLENLFLKYQWSKNRTYDAKAGIFFFPSC